MNSGGSDPAKELREHHMLWTQRATQVHANQRLEALAESYAKMMRPSGVDMRGASICVWMRAARLMGELGGKDDSGGDGYEPF